MIPTGMKTRVSDLLIAGNGGAAERRASEMAKKLNIAVDQVMTEFGFDITLMHNYIMQLYAGPGTAETIYLYDSGALKRSVLQEYDFDPDLRGRYGKAGIIFCEETLEVADPSSVAMISGVQATT